jgi:hypothetical protein
MPISINGSGSITGISAGGLPDGVVTTPDIAAGAVTQAKRSEQLTLGTPVASTSGTSIDFTGIPSWVKRVTVMFNGVSLSGSSYILVQIGANGAAEIASYTSGSSRTGGSGATAYTSATTGFLVYSGAGAETPSGLMSLQTIGSNLWVSAHALNVPPASCTISGAGSKTLSGTLDRVRITTVNGTDTFDAGSINIMYE